jgi:hypothetical protein
MLPGGSWNVIGLVSNSPADSFGWDAVRVEKLRRFGCSEQLKENVNSDFVRWH